MKVQHSCIALRDDIDPFVEVQRLCIALDATGIFLWKSNISDSENKIIILAHKYSEIHT